MRGVMTKIIAKERLLLRTWENPIAIGLSLALLCSCSSDQAKQITLPDIETKSITSKENNVKYKLFISLPEGYYSKDHYSYKESYPVLYLLDPDVEFLLAEI